MEKYEEEILKKYSGKDTEIDTGNLKISPFPFDIPVWDERSWKIKKYKHYDDCGISDMYISGGSVYVVVDSSVDTWFGNLPEETQKEICEHLV